MLDLQMRIVIVGVVKLVLISVINKVLLVLFVQILHLLVHYRKYLELILAVLTLVLFGLTLLV